MLTRIRTKSLMNPHGGALERGVRVTKNNVNNLVAWINKNGGKAEFIAETSTTNFAKSRRLRVKTKKGWRVAFIGDVILRDGEVFGVLKQEDFLLNGWAD